MINKDPYIDVQKGHYNVKTRANGLWVHFYVQQIWNLQVYGMDVMIKNRKAINRTTFVKQACSDSQQPNQYKIHLQRGNK